MSEKHGLKRLQAYFFAGDSGRQPVRDWLLNLRKEDRRILGRDLMTLEFGWPIGMPLSRPMGRGLHELRTTLSGNRSARVFFYVDAKQRLILLHAFLKTSRTTPLHEMKIARDRMKLHQSNLE